jgi:chemosensory pili system protein ChpA (sensor histidine kinase/response regulator)
MNEVDRELINVFLAEAGDELASIKANTDRWRKHHEDVETLQGLVRSYHTLKGAGRIIGANAVSVLSWSVEELLRRAQDGRAMIGDALFDLLEQAVTALGELVKGIEQGQESDVRAVQPLIDMARELRKSAQVAGGSS